MSVSDRLVKQETGKVVNRFPTGNQFLPRDTMHARY